MEEMLLFLSLKHKGNWLAIYNSIKNKERLEYSNVQKEISAIESCFLSLLDNKYCENLKTINKPPFGVYYYGIYSLLNTNCLTILGDLDNDNLIFLKMLAELNISLIWPNLSINEINNVLNNFSYNNIFYFTEMKKCFSIPLKNIVGNDIINCANVFISEIWQKNKNVDYIDQAEERMYVGISKKIFIISNIGSKQLINLETFCKNEDVQIYILKNIYDQSKQKYLNLKNVKIISNLEDLKIKIAAFN